MQSADGSSRFPAQSGSGGDQPAPTAETQGGIEAMVPAELVESAPEPVFYRIDCTRIRFVEHRWGGPLPLAILSWLLTKGLRVQVPGSTDDPAVESLNDFEVAPEAVPAKVQERLAPSARELAALGFHSPVYHAIDDVRQSTRTYLASFAHPTRPVVARLHNRVWSIRTPAKDVLFTEFITAFPNGEFLWTLSSKADLLAPSICRIARQEGATPLELWRLHEQELAMQRSGRTALPAMNGKQVLSVGDRLHAAVRDFHLQRGVFAPLTPADEQRRISTLEVRHQAATGGWKHPEILAELDRLQQKKTSSLGGLLILVVSVLLFLGVGLPGQSSFLRVLAIVPILFFHECGHYLAMRASGYRNLRVFFIPGFGAAVTGQHYNVPGWKKVIVSLMGPLPGIFVGLILGLCGLVWERPVVLEAAVLVLILNGINLVPLLPLDGGHVVHTVLFSRSYLLDILFRIGAAAVLAGCGLLLRDRLLFVLAVLMCVGLPGVVRVAQVARQLRREGFVPLSSDNQTIPPDVAEQIIAKLKKDNDKPQHNKVIAQRVLQVFETLNTRPPGWLASIAFLSFHFMSFLCALGCTLFFSLALYRGRSWEALRSSVQAARYRVSVADIRMSPGAEAAAVRPGIHDTIVATFAKPAPASAAYQEAVSGLRTEEAATLLGNTVLIRFPVGDSESRERWTALLAPRAEGVFVNGEGKRAHFSFSGIAKDEPAAQAMVEELTLYFSLPLAEGMIAPWSTTKVLRPEQSLARRTYRRLLTDESHDDPAARKLREQIDAARRKRDKAEVKTLTKQYRRLVAEVRRRNLEEAAGDESGAVDTEMARRYFVLYDELKPAELDQQVIGEMAPRLGLAWPIAGAPESGGDATCASMGFAANTGRLVQIPIVIFHDPAPGAAAMIAWLDAQGCQALRYDVNGAEHYSEFDDEATEEDEEGPEDGEEEEDQPD